MRRLLAFTTILSAAVATLVAIAMPATAAPRCFGRAATIIGTEGPDEITGTSDDDVIITKGGSDVVAGLDGNDRICTGDGVDDVAGGKGRDAMNAGSGRDILLGQHGNDRLIAGAGNDLAYGGPGRDTLRGLRGDDSLLGNADDDRLDGGPGRDRLYGQQGDDRFGGGAGRDLATFHFSSRRVTANLTTGRARGEGRDELAGIEDLSGSKKDDRLIGDADVNVFYGLRGDDIFEGRDQIDTVSFATSENPVNADLVADEANGEGNDTLLGIEDLVGSRFSDTLRGDAFVNVIFGFDGADNLFGREADDVLHGGDGNDSGDGGLNGLGGDRCISIENETGCEN